MWVHCSLNFSRLFQTPERTVNIFFYCSGIILLQNIQELIQFNGMVVQIYFLSLFGKFVVTGQILLPRAVY